MSDNVKIPVVIPVYGCKDCLALLSGTLIVYAVITLVRYLKGGIFDQIKQRPLYIIKERIN